MTSSQAIHTALITGFEPFGGETFNPSWAAASAFHDATIAGFSVLTARLPVVFQQAADALDTLIQKHQPDLVIALGQAGGRSRISLERVALNWLDARIADNLGQLPKSCQIAPDCPAALFAPFPIDAAFARLQALNIPIEISLSAGSYVCNELYFRLCQTQQRKPDMQAVFVHIPFAPEQVIDRNIGQASLPIDMTISALHALLEVASERQKP